MSNMKSHKKSGFTVIELIIVIAIFGVATTLFFVQKIHLDAIARDEQRKIAINAIYYNLEDFYDNNKYYPGMIDENNLTAMDPALFTDPYGYNLDSDPEADLSSYRYETTDCDDSGEKCQHYTLRSLMEKEADYIKSSRH